MAERKNDINWFPGHMRKALNETGERLKLVDLVYETADARIPFSSRNPELDRIIGDKPRIVILNKADLADPSKRSGSIKERNNWKSGSFPLCGVAVRSRKSLALSDRSFPRPKRFVLLISPLKTVADIL